MVWIRIPCLSPWIRKLPLLFPFFANLPSSSTHKGGVRRADIVIQSPFLSRRLKKKVKMLVAHSCPTLCDPMAGILPGSSVHGILQASILEWVANPFSRGSSWPRDWTRVSCTSGGFFTIWATREAQKISSQSNLKHRTAESTYSAYSSCILKYLPTCDNAFL